MALSLLMDYNRINSVNVKKTIYIIVILLLAALILGSKNQLVTSPSNQNLNSKSMDRSKKYVVFPADYSAPFIMEKAQRYTPSDQDIQDGMQILENHLKNNSAIRDLKEYKIQFFGYISEDKEKILWANCFCDAHGVDWQKNLVFVKDGGNCFLNLKINLDKKEIFDLAINGEA